MEELKDFLLKEYNIIFDDMYIYWVEDSMWRAFYSPDGNIQLKINLIYNTKKINYHDYEISDLNHIDVFIKNKKTEYKGNINSIKELIDKIKEIFSEK